MTFIIFTIVAAPFGWLAYRLCRSIDQGLS